MQPENASLLKSVAYCEFRINEIDENFKKCMADGVRVDKNLRELRKVLASTKSTIEQGCQTGAFSPQDYSNMLKELLVKD